MEQSSVSFKVEKPHDRLVIVTRDDATPYCSFVFIHGMGENADYYL